MKAATNGSGQQQFSFQLRIDMNILAARMGGICLTNYMDSIPLFVPSIFSVFVHFVTMTKGFTYFGIERVKNKKRLKQSFFFFVSYREIIRQTKNDLKTNLLSNALMKTNCYAYSLNRFHLNSTLFFC